MANSLIWNRTVIFLPYTRVGAGCVNKEKSKLWMCSAGRRYFLGECVMFASCCHGAPKALVTIFVWYAMIELKWWWFSDDQECDYMNKKKIFIIALAAVCAAVLWLAIGMNRKRLSYCWHCCIWVWRISIWVPHFPHSFLPMWQKCWWKTSVSQVLVLWKKIWNCSSANKNGKIEFFKIQIPLKKYMR